MSLNTIKTAALIIRATAAKTGMSIEAADAVFFAAGEIFIRSILSRDLLLLYYIESVLSIVEEGINTSF